MVIATMKDPAVTPVDTCAWSVKRGYKALNQGTYYSYFRPQLAAYGIECKQLLSGRIINQPNHAVHGQVKEYLAQGYYVIALMGPGTWTTGGHFVLLYGWDDKVRINDPASTKDKRLNGDPATFRNEARNYWLVDARSHNNGEDDEDMTPDKFAEMFLEMRKSLKDNDSSTYSQEARKWSTENGLIAGNGTEVNGEPNYMWEDLMTREQFVTVLHRFAQMMGKA